MSLLATPSSSPSVKHVVVIVQMKDKLTRRRQVSYPPMPIDFPLHLHPTPFSDPGPTTYQIYARSIKHLSRTTLVLLVHVLSTLFHSRDHHSFPSTSFRRLDRVKTTKILIPPHHRRLCVLLSCPLVITSLQKRHDTCDKRRRSRSNERDRFRGHNHRAVVADKQ